MALPPPMMSAAQSRSGAVAVRTTQVGLPVALRIDPRKLQGDPQALADEILRLSRLAAMRAQVEIRRNSSSRALIRRSSGMRSCPPRTICTISKNSTSVHRTNSPVTDG